MTRRAFGNARRADVNDVRMPMTAGSTAAMAWSQAPELPKSFPPRPMLVSQQSSSLPSTPYQHPRDRTFRSRTPSPARSALNASPRSSHSESNQSLTALRRVPGGCKYESGMAQARRRVPYSLGPDKLNPEQIPLKAHLTPMEDARLSGDMRELYDRLTPSPKSEERRKKLVRKLEDMLHATWPEHSIKVEVFGSTGNRLGTNNSDVDICIMTDHEDLEQVCCLADLLARYGMERVVCVSGAKVPIVKFWDPELELACDMNVNNPVALENTEMIRTYVDIDDRVRPLAMIIKYWAKRRVLNDPALGSTLSSYTWICMIINFLQTRNPPVLPSLQQQAHLKKRVMNGVNVAFDKDVTSYCGFGAKNKESLGELLLQFFRYYGHEIDFEQSVMSVRLGRVISKTEKGWHRLLDNRICVEEPFNIRRNLANTADDTSVRGIHVELRRAFKILIEVDLDTCCEQYEHPLDEGKSFEKPTAPPSRPIVTQAPPQSTRGARGGGRGGRNAGHYVRGPHSSARRASTPSNRGQSNLRNLPFHITSEELQLQAQHQQYLLHDQLFHQYQLLQAQEQELRLQLHQQAILQGHVTPSMTYPHIPFPSYSTSKSRGDETTRTRAGTVNHPPLSAPLRQQGFSYTSPHFYGGGSSGSESATNPPSPLLHSVVPGRRRNAGRSTLASGSAGGSLRAQSQPARPMSSSLSFHTLLRDFSEEQDSMGRDPTHHRRIAASPRITNGVPAASYVADGRFALPISAYDAEKLQTEYVGYYVGHSPPVQAYKCSVVPSPAPGDVGLAIHHGGSSPHLFASTPTYRSAALSASSERVQTPNAESSLEIAGSLHSPAPASTGKHYCSPAKQEDGPLVVNGSIPSFEMHLDHNSEIRGNTNGTTFSGSTSDDLAFDTPTSSDDASQGLPEFVIADNDSSTGVMNDSSAQSQSSPSRLDALDITHVNDAVSVHGSISLSRPVDDKQASGLTGTVEVEHLPSHGLGRKTDVTKENGQLSALPERKKGQSKVDPQLSPVREISSPSTESRGPATVRKIISTSISNEIGEKAALPKADVQSDKPEPLGPKTNGIDTATVSKTSQLTNKSSTGWQTQRRKKHKKGSKSETDINMNAIAGDFVPTSASLRKGG